MRPVSTFILALLLFTGCASTEKRYEKAQTLEEEGRYAEAADYYIRVLEKEPTWREARMRLQASGARAIDAYLEDARRVEALGDFEEAADVLHQLDELREAAAAVSTNLTVPDDYTAYRDGLNERAVASLIAQGEVAEANRDYGAAMKAYERVQEDYPVSPEETEAMDERWARALTRWAAYDLERLRYRTAFDRVAPVFERFDPEHPAVLEAIRLQEDAVAAGTRFVAFLPFSTLEAWDREAPRALEDDINDVLAYEYWIAPPRFIATADPVLVRRELRRLRFDRTNIDRNQATEIGRVLEADYVVTGEMVRFERKEKVAKEEVRDARTRGRGARDTSYVFQRVDVTLIAWVEYQVVDPETRRVVAEERVEREAKSRLERGNYPGDYRDLDLPSKERRLFDPEEQDAGERDLQDALLDELTAEVAASIFESILKRLD